MSQQRMPHRLEIKDLIAKGQNQSTQGVELLDVQLVNALQQNQELQQELDKAKKRISELEPNTKKPETKK